MELADKERKKPEKKSRKHTGRPKRLLALLLIFLLTGTGSLETVFTKINSPELVFADTGAVEAGLVQPEESELPTGLLPYDIRELSEEEIPDDVPVYGNIATFSFDGAESYNFTGAESRYGYAHLSSSQQKLYTDFLEGITEFLEGNYKTKNFTENKDAASVFGVNYLKYGLKKADLSAAYYCLRNDYPEFFWLYPGYGYTADTVYIEIDKEYYQASVRTKTGEAIEKGTEEYLDAVKGEKDTYKILRIIHDKLINEVEYAYTAGSGSKPEKALWAHSIAGVFDGKNAVVCEGYAKALQHILNQLGIENVYMTGAAKGGAHAWNGVKIGTQWFYVDATWDDAGAEYYQDNGGLIYLYFCIPASVFTKEHKVDTPSSSEWLYDIPTMSESKEYTFYTQYSCDFTGVTSVEEAKKLLDTAGKSVPGSYIHALVSPNTKNYFVGAVAGELRGIVAPDGNSVFFVDAAPYKVKYPAVEIKLSKETITIDRDKPETIVLTAELKAAGENACDDVVRWSSSSNCVTLVPGADGKSVKLIGKRNGTAVITAAAAAGSAEPKTCTVEVIGTAEYDNIYLDAGFNTTPEEEDLTIWVNGGNVGATKDTKYNYKVRTLYTSIRASDVTVSDSKGRMKTKKGKLVAGITLSSEQPELVKGKIVDVEAAKIAKAAVNAKTGLVKVTAQKQTGEVYLWVLDTGDQKAVAYAKITVTAAPAKILLNDENGQQVKKQTLAIGESMQVFLEPLLASKGAELAQGGSYSVAYSKNGEKYVEVAPIAGSTYGYQITPVALDTAKAGKTLNVKVNFVCNENNKKASVSIMITNPIEDITFEAGSGLTMTGENTFTVKYSETQAQNLTLNFTTEAAEPSCATTDKPKIYALSGEDSFSTDEKGKPVVTKPTGAAAKLKASLSSDKKSIVIKVPKKLEVGTKTYFALYFNPDCFGIYSVEVVE